MEKVKNNSVAKRMSLLGWILSLLFIATSAALGAMNLKYPASNLGNTFSFSENGLVYYDDGTVSTENDYSKNVIEKKDDYTYFVTIFDAKTDRFVCEDLYFAKSFYGDEEEGLIGRYSYSNSSYLTGYLDIYESTLKITIESDYGTLQQEYAYKKSGNFLKSYVPASFDLRVNRDDSVDFSVVKEGKTYAYSFPASAKNSEGDYLIQEGFETVTLNLTEFSLYVYAKAPFLETMEVLSEGGFLIASIGAALILLIQLITVAMKKDYKIRAKSLAISRIGLIFGILLIVASVVVPAVTPSISFTPFDPLFIAFPAFAILLMAFSLFFLIDTSKKGKPIKEAREAYLAERREQKAKEKQELKAKNEALKAKKAEEKRLEEERKREEKRLEEEKKSEERRAQALRKEEEKRAEALKKEEERVKRAEEQKERKLALDKQKEETRVVKEANSKERAETKEKKLKENFALRPLYFLGPILALTVYCAIFVLLNADCFLRLAILAIVLFVAILIVAIVGACNYKRMKKMFFVSSVLLFAFLLFVGMGGFAFINSAEGFVPSLIHPLFYVEEIIVVLAFVAFLVSYFLIKEEKTKDIACVSLLGGAFFFAFLFIEIYHVIGAMNGDLDFSSISAITIVGLLFLPIVVASLYFTFLSLYRPVSEAEVVALKKREQERVETKEEKKLEKEYDAMNKEFNAAIKNKDFAKAKELEGKIKLYEESHGMQKASYFDGGLLSYFGWSLLGNLLTVITFGIAYPWAVCFIKRWEVKHTVIASRRLIFTGKGGQLFVKYIVWWLLSIITFGIYFIFVPLKMEKWVASHTFDAPLDKVEHVKKIEEEAEHAATSHNVDEAERLSKELEEYKKENEILGESYFDGKLLQLIGWNILCFLVTVLTLGIAKPFATCWMMKWKMKHQVILGRRLSFDGNGLQLIGRYVLWLLLTLITLGIYGLWLNIKLKKWETKHIHFANEEKKEKAKL